MVTLSRLVINSWAPVDSRDPSARAPCHSIDPCSHPMHHTSRPPLAAVHSESRGCPRVLSAGRCSNPRSGHFRTKACLISWTSRRALPARENKLALQPVRPIFYLILTGVFVKCVCVCIFFCSVSTSMVDTRRDLLARESVMVEVLLLWASVIFRPLGGSHVPICWNNLLFSLNQFVSSTGNNGLSFLDTYRGDTFSKPSSFRLMTSRSKSVLRPFVLLNRTRPVRPSQWACRQKLMASETGIQSNRVSIPESRQNPFFPGLIRNSVCLWPLPSTPATK